jgi:adenosylhomocysteine nucleosidase
LSKVGVVVGLAAEARIARRLGHPVAVGGGGPAGAEEAARRLLADGAGALLSFGLCGGLDPALAPGTVLIPQTVLDGGTRHATSSDIAAPFGALTPHLLLAVTRIVATAAEKRRLHDATGAAAIDIESGAVARVAAASGRPFAVLRAVCDPAWEDLPPAALVALDSHGAIGFLKVLAALARHPAQLPALMALAGHAAAGRRSLLRAVAPENRYHAAMPPGG